MRTEFNKDDAGEYRWTTKAPNGEIIGTASEGFTRRRTAIDNFFLNHPELDRNSIQTNFDGTQYIMHN